MFHNLGHSIDLTVRVIALAAGAAAVLVLLTHWSVRRQALAPFGWWPRLVRRWSDPVVQPIERRLLRAGASPQDAPLWLVGVTLVLGLLAITAVRWLLSVAALLGSMQNAGVTAWLRLAVIAASSLVSLAIIVRVVGSWLGAGRYNRGMRPVFLLSDWIVEPIRRRLPGFGPLDLSPLVAYVLILVLRGFLLNIL
ncbi:MAG TPA: YggT family protein [Gemmatimonadales bacterium]|jgi:YggT family protein